MSTAEYPIVHTTKTPDIHEWETFAGNRTFECRAILLPDGEGYSALALQLPGVASQGDTDEEAIQNLTDAFRAAIECYLEDGGSIPWKDYDPSDPLKHLDLEEVPKETRSRWILVNV
jgi:predicted RNase H-like HicB family nuclease